MQNTLTYLSPLLAHLDNRLAVIERIGLGTGDGQEQIRATIAECRQMAFDLNRFCDKLKEHLISGTK